MGMKSAAGGEIIQVQGGHIVRSTGRKDRHSKVYTAKGPRDRRVRLSAHTAIQFYDVQDRLGYDRPSKAVDWLIKKAKSAIDKLAELPPWHPNAANTSTADMNADLNGNNNSTENMGIQEQSDTLGYNSYQLQRQLAENQNNDSSSFIPQPLDSEAIADTMKSFFPTSSAASSMNFQSYPHEIISRGTNPSEDLGLSLHSYHEPSLLHAQSQGETSHHHAAANDQTLFPGGFDNSAFQRMVAWSSEANRGGYVFHAQPLPQPHQQQQQQQGAEALLSHGSAFSQRGPLQSSFVPSIRAWENFSVDHHQKAQASIFGGRFSSDGLPGFCIPAQIHGQDHHGVVSDRPSSSSPSSHQ